MAPAVAQQEEGEEKKKSKKDKEGKKDKEREKDGEKSTVRGQGGWGLRAR